MHLQRCSPPPATTAACRSSARCPDRDHRRRDAGQCRCKQEGRGAPCASQPSARRRDRRPGGPGPCAVRAREDGPAPRGRVQTVVPDLRAARCLRAAGGDRWRCLLGAARCCARRAQAAVGRGGQQQAGGRAHRSLARVDEGEKVDVARASRQRSGSLPWMLRAGRRLRRLAALS